MDHRDYVRRETSISIVINVVLTVLIFVGVFGVGHSVSVWGVGNWVFDFLPQSFMIALMSTLVPGALTSRKIAAGKLARAANASRLPDRLVLRALFLAVASAIVGTAIVALGAFALTVDALGFFPALAFKMAYAVLLAAFVTPIGLRAALAARN